jgi:predicted CoA-binding protein
LQLGQLHDQLKPLHVQSMLKPTIAVVGASAQRHKFGNQCVRAYAAKGYDVYPVNPREVLIEGHRTFATLANVPLPRLDRVSIYLPPDVCLRVLPELAKKPAGEFWFNPGADREDVIAEARALGMNVVTGCSIVNIGASPY